MKKIRPIRLISLILLAAAIGRACSPSAPQRTARRSVPTQTIVLLHGLARSDRAMNKMAKELRAEGYRVINHDYPSTTARIETLSNQIFKDLASSIDKAERVHFVTHSMGGTILHYHLEHNTITNLGRVVMLAPPIGGSEVTDKLGDVCLYKWINGPAGNQLGTKGTNSIPLRLSAPTFPLGIIAGDRSINPILSLLIPGSDDGKVAVARSKPETCTDYRLFHVTHACMVWNPKVIEQTKHFLEHGHFKVDEASCLVRQAQQNTGIRCKANAQTQPHL